VSETYVDLSGFFPPGYGGPPDPEEARRQREHQERLNKAAWEMEAKNFGRMQFFGAMLCRCPRRFTGTSEAFPQLECPLHSRIMADQAGRIMLFGIPSHW
jgi:hypothetical protein